MCILMDARQADRYMYIPRTYLVGDKDIRRGETCIKKKKKTNNGHQERNE